MSEVIKQVKVDNWGIYFLQRLKHFFNRTDYCDLTLQFQDNAQLKVHRLVLSACTEYFELLERTCEMYEDCLVMPDDLQADVVVPIINFMYTGQLEFKIDLLEKLYQTSLIMNMPVLTKLLSSHRNQPIIPAARSPAPAYYGKRYVKQPKSTPPTNSSNKRVFSSAFNNTDTPMAKRVISLNKSEISFRNGAQDTSASHSQLHGFSEKKNQLTKGARPTRYELPEELEEENIFDNSFTSISYTSKPLMVHPESTKQYGSKRINLFEEGTSSSRFMHISSNNDIVECKKISVNESMFLDESSDMIEENDIFQQSSQNKEEPKDANQLFDQIIENDLSNITIETKNKQSGNLDHAKIISEVLKKYPHLVKSNKQIKLKILNTTATKDTKSKKTNRVSNIINEEDRSKNKTDPRDFTYETDVIDSKEAARLIALGAENVKGPWICLICGTPGKALHFTSYYNFRKHLVEVHHEKPVPNICEYCGLKSLKRNYLVHHQLTKHGVEPPSHYNFPKCNNCDYVALNEALFVKHKMTHTDLTNFKRNICNVEYAVSLMNSQKTNNKVANFDKKKNLICMYCLRVFLRQKNLYAHLKTNHKEAAKNDGLIYDSDDEPQEEEEKVTFKQNTEIKVEVPITYECDDVQYQLERRPDGNIHVVPKKSCVVMPKHKILNSGFVSQQQVLPSINKTPQKAKNLNNPIKRNEYLQEICLSPSTNIKQEEIVVIDNNEYIVRDFQLYPKNPTGDKEETIGTIIPTTSMEFHNIQTQTPETKMFIKKSTNLNQPLQIVVSNEEEYKTLIGSNQSVIFNETETGKTLTVLAASDSNTMETSAIDLNNTQTNEMMIIPDDFPINVSEAVAADNPNIVVVYSHPVEDPNKQYQLITAQEVGVEFVQSSEILTQSFETVTTCTSVASTHITGEPWPANVQATINKLPITSVAELQAMTVAQSVTVPCDNNVNEYPEVPLASTVQEPLENKIIDAQDIQNQFQECNNITSMHQVNTETVSDQNSIIAVEQTTTPNIIQQETIVEPQIHSLPIDNITPNTVMNDLIQQLTAEQQSSISNPNPVVEVAQEVSSSVTMMSEVNSVPNMLQSVIVNNDIQSIENIENENVDMVPSSSDTCSMDQIVASSSNEQIEPEVITSPEISEVIHKVNDIQSIENSEIPLNDDNEVAETIENIAKVIGIDPKTLDKEISLEVPQTSVNHTQNIVDNEDVTLKKVTNEQIQSLTSEWSEDDSDVAESVPSNSENVNAEITGDHIEKVVELEESIENIQQEVESHVPADDVVENTESENVSANDMPDQPSGVKTTGTVIVPNEKISTLLNDWDDNDSQEEDVTVEPSKSEEPTPMVHNLEVEVIKSEVNDDLSKNDKIKSLVSDWDEEEDESKD